MSVTEVVVGILVLLAFGGMIGYAVFLKYKNIRLASQLVQAVVDKNTVSKQLLQLTSNKTVKDLEEKDGFIKFLTDSRESAFEYIEQVQTSLYLYKDTMEPIIESYRASGSGSESMQQIVKAYDDIVALLPAEE